ncbi:hypothetical protein SAMN05880501_10835 [Ureibacillus xyleni]|uniref:Uncharacterized protein n=1 Tax=Ureibacillus xyleni TaxID=614648 RepID=A0A285T1H5_9BACL|nr:hypothetical protein [Ureibacillus xyleni]SOC15102.1 hypothetical protein SAMN05880501_10835 [Ureibacillus xyleni]
MGSSWEKWGIVSSAVEAKRPCNCGAGEVLIMVEIEDSNEQPLGKIKDRYLKINCPNKCE